MFAVLVKGIKWNNTKIQKKIKCEGGIIQRPRKKLSVKA